MNNENKEASEIEKKKILNMAMPMLKLLFLLLITFTLYTPLWFYSKWKSLNDVKGKNILLALSTGIPFLGLIPHFILFKNIFKLIFINNKIKVYILSFSLSFLWFAVVYSTCIYLKITSSILFSICFYIPSLLVAQFIINKKEKQNAPKK